MTDSDGTLMGQDVGDVLMEGLDVLNEPKAIEASRHFREKKVGSLAWIEAAYPMLEGRREQVDKLIESVHLRDGAKDFIDFCQQKDASVTVLSDGMLYYIEQILSRQQVKVDWIFARASLARYLKEEGTAYYPFETFHDILNILRPAWDSYLSGTAIRRLQ